MGVPAVARVRVVSPRSRKGKSERDWLGVTKDQYDRLLAAQGGHCALCPSTPKTRRLHVDHEHRSGRVRGLLCHRCNRQLPAWVTAGWLIVAIQYLGERYAYNSVMRAVLDEINGNGEDGES